MQNGILISTLRVENNISQKKMAQYLKVSLKTYKNYENETFPMNIACLNIISNKFKVSMDYLLGLTNNNNYLNNYEFLNYRFLKSELKRIRSYYGYTQESLAYQFDISINTLRNYENKMCMINASYLYKFAKKFNVSVDYLCGKRPIEIHKKRSISF